MKCCFCEFAAQMVNIFRLLGRIFDAGRPVGKSVHAALKQI
jgi:hypothetical protein